MDKFITPPLREKLWGIFLAGILATFLSMLQSAAAAHGIECGPSADPVLAGGLGMGLRAAIYSVRLT